MTRVSVVPATIEDFVEVYGHHPERSFQGFAVRTPDHVAAVCGLYQAEGKVIAFSQIVPPVPRRGAVLAAKRLLALMRAKGGRVFALRDASLPTSGTLLEHLGFRPVGETPAGGVYLWHG